jgi:acetyltransferase-like isoleucine patch superfamily enzyme
MARKNGATIGEAVTMPYRLAKKANSNLRVGDHSSIDTDLIGLRAKVTIGNHVIIGKNVEILTGSHTIDSVDWEWKGYGIEIEDYCWLATRALVLPSCRKIGYGAVCAAGSVVAKNIESLSIVSGNPAQPLRKRTKVHSDLCVESLHGNDFKAYVQAYQSK